MFTTLKARVVRLLRYTTFMNQLNKSELLGPNWTTLGPHATRKSLHLDCPLCFLGAQLHLCYMQEIHITPVLQLHLGQFPWKCVLFAQPHKFRLQALNPTDDYLSTSGLNARKQMAIVEL